MSHLTTRWEMFLKSFKQSLLHYPSLSMLLLKMRIWTLYIRKLGSISKVIRLVASSPFDHFNVYSIKKLLHAALYDCHTEQISC